MGSPRIDLAIGAAQPAARQWWPAFLADRRQWLNCPVPPGIRLPVFVAISDGLRTADFCTRIRQASLVSPQVRLPSTRPRTAKISIC